MKFYYNYLKWLGLINILNNSTKFKSEIKKPNNIIIDVDSELNLKISSNNNSNKFKYYKLIVNYIYISFITCLLCWKFVYSIYLTRNKHNWKYLTSNIFDFAFILQYIFAILYYNEHFNNVNNKKSDYIKIINFLLLLSSFISITISIVSILCLVLNVNLVIYSDIYNNIDLKYKILFTILIFFSKFYSYNILLVNALTFSIIFITLSIEIGEYSEKLVNDIEKSTNDLTIESILKEYTELKSNHTKSVQKMNKLFSSITILGILNVYYITNNFNSNFVDILHYIQIFIFLLVEVIYIISMSIIRNKVDDISKIIGSTKFISRFLSRQKLESFTSELNNNEIDDKSKKIDYIKDLSIRNVIKIHENAEYLDWIVLNNKLNGNWDQFQILGFDIQDTVLLQKIIGIVIGFFMLVNFNP